MFVDLEFLAYKKSGIVRSRSQELKFSFSPSSLISACKNRMMNKHLRLAFLLTAAAVAFAASWLTFEGIEVTKHIARSKIKHEIGYAFFVPLRAPWPLGFWSDSAKEHNRSLAILFENGQALGPAHSTHLSIRNRGHGRYSDWYFNGNHVLRFSSSDNSSALTNGRSYSIRLMLIAPPWLLAFSWLLLAVAIIVNRSTLGEALAVKWLLNVPGVRWCIQNVLPGLFISTVLIAILAGGAEAYLRATTPFLSSNWPGRFDGRFGFNFVPGSTIRQTNHVDFWAINRVNSLGFLDREPPKSEYPSPGVCRIVLIGDSFVEARQVPLADKVQIQLDRLLNRGNRGTKFETVAFSNSGTGQANQLPFYDIFARTLHPNVVVLVFVDNDFANNSTVLESIRNGWDPFHPPRLFFKHATNYTVATIPIDPDWAEHLLPAEPALENWHTSVHRFLIAHSYFYNWLFERVSLKYPQLSHWLDGSPAWKKVYADREQEVKRRWADQFDLSGWNYPDDWDMDTVFFATRLAPVFQEALRFTGHALDEFVRRAHRDGFHLMILANTNLYLDRVPQRPEFANPLLKSGQMDRLEALARSRHIPVVDLKAYILSIKGDPRKANFPHDGHWSPQGHLWAAQALNEYIQRHPELCDRPQKTS